MRKRLGSIVITLMILTGALLVAFPFVSQWFTANAQAHEVSEYSIVANQASKDRFIDAVAANEIHDITASLEQLQLDGVESIAALKIPAIDVNIPVYPTDSDYDLQRGAGWMPVTDTPVGGSGTHSAISAHSGMPTKRMFDRLPRLEIGDVFTVEVLGETLVYRVFDIVVDTPKEGTKALARQPGRDLLSLITCTPYGINTHRLIVTAERVEEAPVTTPPSHSSPTPWVAFVVVTVVSGCAYWVYSRGRQVHGAHVAA